MNDEDNIEHLSWFFHALSLEVDKVEKVIDSCYQVILAQSYLDMHTLEKIVILLQEYNVDGISSKKFDEYSSQIVIVVSKKLKN